MPTFDIVSEVDLQEVDNAVNGVKRDITQRYDFKGTNCSVEREDKTLTVMASDEGKRQALEEMLKANFVRRKIDAKVLNFDDAEAASGNMIRQKITVQEGIDKETAKKITKAIKDSKIKVQASIRGEELRVDGKKRDDLQEVMQLVKAMDIPVALQFINFRD